MAKKVVATLKSGSGKSFTKVIKMVKSPKTGAYAFKEEVVHNDHVKDFLSTAK
jgi:ABC-type iron transport system FetAB ATPase subunit